MPPFRPARRSAPGSTTARSSASRGSLHPLSTTSSPRLCRTHAGAGATRVRVTVGTPPGQPAAGAPEPSETPLAVTVADDGAGIEDPAVLLSFGENGWSDELVAREDAAGMGILSLAHRGCRIASRPRTPDGHVGHGWSVDLEPEHFTGRSDAQVRHDDGAPYPSGTAVQFQATESADMIRAAVASAARHYPLPVTFEGETLERRAFLDGAIHAESWNGLTFGVYRDRGRGYLEPDLNFFGLTVPVQLPMVETVHRGIWSVRADVVDCPGLELLLPARREARRERVSGRGARGGALGGLPRHGRRLRSAARLCRLDAGRATRASTSRRRQRSSVPGDPPSPTSTTGGSRRSPRRPVPTHWSWLAIPSPQRRRRYGAR